MTIAIPQFISLLSISVLLKKNGALDQLWENIFGSGLGFAESGHVGFTKFIIVMVNIWVGIPYTILSTTGILLNIPEDLYESARVDGASTVKQFTKITMPYILFVTGPYLITQFVGNFNNFNIIYFLTGGGPNLAGAVLQVGETDILITFLYSLITSASNPQFGIASAVGIFIFMICAFVSIVMYNKSGAIKEEDQFQ
jgi:arabinogalactan oligomer/maltooligosaccharide transport system permease protein